MRIVLSIFFFLMSLQVSIGTLYAETSVSMSPPSGQVGTTFTNIGSGFTPNSTVTLIRKPADGVEKAIARIKTDTTGSFTVTWTAKTTGSNFTWWVVDDTTGKRSGNEVVYSISAIESSTISQPPIARSQTKEQKKSPKVAKPPEYSQETLLLRERIKVYNKKLQNVSSKLLRNIPNPPTIEFKLIASEVVNAWTDGRITMGLMDLLYNDNLTRNPDDKLAMVMAHIIIHEKLETENVNEMLAVGLGKSRDTYNDIIDGISHAFSVVLGPITTPISFAVSEVSGTIAKGIVNWITRKTLKTFQGHQEDTSHLFSILYLKKAGFDASEGLKIFNKPTAFSRQHPIDRKLWKDYTKEVQAKLDNERQLAAKTLTKNVEMSVSTPPYYSRSAKKPSQTAVSKPDTVVSLSKLTIISLIPSSIETSSSPYDPTLSLHGSGFNNVNQIIFNANRRKVNTWKKGGPRWNKCVNILSDTSMNITPRVVEQSPSWSGTLKWTTTLRDTRGATASQNFTVTYRPRRTTKPTDPAHQSPTLRVNSASQDKDAGELIGRYKGVTAYSNGKNAGTTKGDINYQCLAFVQEFYSVIYPWIKTIYRTGGWGDAKTFWDGSHSHFQKVMNDGRSKPQSDDMLFFDVYRPIGHVAIVMKRIGNNKVEIIEQNNDRNKATRIVSLSDPKFKIVGWLHPLSRTSHSTENPSQSAVSKPDTVVSLSKLTIISLIPSSIETSSSPYDTTLSLHGSGFNNVTQIIFNWTGAVSGSAKWNKGDSRWNKSVKILSDTLMNITPRVVEQSPLWSGTLKWITILKDTRGATASQNFTVTYMPRLTIKPTDPAHQSPTLRVNSWAVVSNTYEPGKGYIGLKLRNGPGLNARKTGNLSEGTRVNIKEGPVLRNGITWWHVKSQEGQEGWCAGNWLVPVQKSK